MDKIDEIEKRIEEIVVGQLRSFVFMEGGISDLLTTLRTNLQVTPWKLIITGEGSTIPDIDALFEKGINIKTEAKNWGSLGVKGYMPLTAYGMARAIAVDARATLQLERSLLQEDGSNVHVTREKAI